MPIKFFTELLKALKGATIKTIKELTFPNIMNRREAIKILNVESNIDQEELKEKFKKLYKVNSLENKGSPYIQEKIKNAYEYLKRSDQS